MAKKKKSAKKSLAKKALPDATKQKVASLPKSVGFHYIKSNQFRVIHVDGIHGGITPRAQIQMALFNERHPIPQHVVYKVTPSGTLGEEVRAERVEKNGMVREVDTEAILTLETAKSLVKWLQEKIDVLEKLNAKAPTNLKKASRKRVK